MACRDFDASVLVSRKGTERMLPVFDVLHGSLGSVRSPSPSPSPSLPPNSRPAERRPAAVSVSGEADDPPRLAGCERRRLSISTPAPPSIVRTPASEDSSKGSLRGKHVNRSSSTSPCRRAAPRSFPRLTSNTVQ